MLLNDANTVDFTRNKADFKQHIGKMTVQPTHTHAYIYVDISTVLHRYITMYI